MAKKHQITDDNIINFLHESNFEADDLQGSDPLVSSRIRVTLDQVRAFDNNPRSTQNPKFDSIMASIENRGLDNPPNISRRPGEEHYIILDGGNTRLEILNTLHQKYLDLAQQAETEEERFELSNKANRFFEFECVFKPWKGESSALAGHMAENEERGETKFIEKALAVQKFRDVYLDEDREAADIEGRVFEEKPLSIRKLAERITTQGWTISHTHITRFDYAANALLPVLPQCLWAGAGFPVVVNIRKHETAYTEFWASTSIGQSDPEKIQEYFFKVLHDFDNETIDFKAFLNALNLELADIVDMQPHIIMAEVEAIMKGVPRDQVQSSGSDSGERPSTGIDDVINTYKETSSSPTRIPASQSSGNETAAGTKKASNKTSKSQSVTQEPQTSTAGTNWQDMDFDSLKNQLIESVTHLQERYPGLGTAMTRDIFLNVFIVPPYHYHDQPEFSYQFNDDDEEASIWWFLFRCTQSFESVPKEALHASLLGWYQNYTHLGNFMDVVLYLEQVFLRLPREVKRILFDIQLIIDEMYAQYETQMKK